MERVSIFIDGENFFGGIRSIDIGYSEFRFDFENYIKAITKGMKLIDVYYVIAPLKQQLNPNKYSQQQRMFTRFKKLGWKVILCKRMKRDTSNGKEKHVIKEDDIRLSLCMLRDAYKNKYDVAFLFSGDGDFVPLPEFIGEKGKRVKVFHFKDSISIPLLRACDFKGEKITKKTLNKFFLRDIGKK